ncbi:MAG: hypothetical protein VX938_02365, partial [Myxococcota bacterium]|nr:hypothetical protein [Myxococcota bacterium]
MSLSRAVAMGLALVVILIPLGANAQSMWRDYREDCDETAFDTPEVASIEKIARCARLWHAYRDMEAVGRFERKRVIHALERLYSEGTEADMHVARLGLARLASTAEPERRGPRQAPTSDEGRASTGADASTTAAGPERAVPLPGDCKTEAPSDGQRRVADKFIKKARALLRAGRDRAALSKAQGAVEAAPGYVEARYETAVMHARLDQADEA